MKWYRIRTKFLLTVFAIFTPLIGFYFYYKLPTGPAKDLNTLSDGIFSKIWSVRQILLVGMGDSIVTGFGSGKSEHGFYKMLLDNPDSEYPDMKGKTLRKVFPNLKHINIAMNSTTSGDHIEQIETLPAQLTDTFGIVILSTGGIDLIHNYGRTAPVDQAAYGATKEQIPKFAALFERRLDKLLNRIEKKFPGGVRILLFSIYDPTDGIGDIENVHPYLRLLKPLPKWPEGLMALTTWNKIIRQKATENSNVVLVDNHSLFLGHGLHCEDKTNPYYHPEAPYYWYFENLEDPNKYGYDAIRRYILKIMAKEFSNGLPRA